MAYPSRADLVSASSVTALTGLGVAQQDGLRAEAIVAIEGFTGQSFTPEGTTEDPVVRTLDSPGGDVLALPKRLASLSAFTFAGTLLEEGSVSLSGDNDRLILEDPRAGGSWLQRIQAQRDSATLAFPAGPGLVTVSGVWGWTDEEFPDDVGLALRYDMEDRALANAHKLSSTIRSARALGVSSVDQGGLSINLDDDEPEVSTRVARLLGDYVWASAAGALA